LKESVFKVKLSAEILGGISKNERANNLGENRKVRKKKKRKKKNIEFEVWI